MRNLKMPTGSRRIEWQHLVMTSGQCFKLQRGEQILPFEVGVVGQDIFDCHARSEKIE